MKLYNNISELEKKYIDLGGESITVKEGCLGYGISVFTAEGYKSAVITEVPLNCWSSAHKVRFYNRLPKKYAEAIKKKKGGE